MNDDAIVRALETAPSVEVPEDFTSRLMAQIPRQRVPGVRSAEKISARPSLGRVLVWVGTAVVFAAMLRIAPHTAGSAVWLWMQVLLFLEFSGLLLWCVYRAARL